MTTTDPDELQLGKLAKKMLATPPKPHSEMKIGKRKAKAIANKKTIKPKVHEGQGRG
jgi:hypothetical protein